MAQTWDDLASPKTFLPGVAAKKVRISAACRSTHGDDGARAIAVDQIDAELKALLAARKDPATFHLVLTVDTAGR